MPLTDVELAKIRNRWDVAGVVAAGWGHLSERRRDRVLGELEETARQEDDKELAADLWAAIDALDLIGRNPGLDLVAHALSDVRALLQALSEKK
jgi:hypothetical protein